MKLELSIFQQISVNELCNFLSWFSRQPHIDMTYSYLEKNSPVRTSKLSPLLKLSDQLGFLAKRQHHIVLTGGGKEFADSTLLVKRAVLKILFSKDQRVQKIQDLLKTSSNGRVSIHQALESFSVSTSLKATEQEVLSWVEWIVYCQIFEYDSKTREFFLTASPPMNHHEPLAS